MYKMKLLSLLKTEGHRASDVLAFLISLLARIKSLFPKHYQGHTESSPELQGLMVFTKLPLLLR